MKAILKGINYVNENKKDTLIVKRHMQGTATLRKV